MMQQGVLAMMPTQTIGTGVLNMNGTNVENNNEQQHDGNK